MARRKIPKTLREAKQVVQDSLAKHRPSQEALKPGHVQIPLAKVLTLVFNMLEPTADKNVGPELLAEYVGHFTEEDLDDFVMHTVRRLPGYTTVDGLRIAQRLGEWQKRYFSQPRDQWA